MLRDSALNELCDLGQVTVFIYTTGERRIKSCHLFRIPSMKTFWVLLILQGDVEEKEVR